ncbi:MAG: DUF4864 domain-containing protein [Thermodesulfobacteriota bacterium]
MQARTPGERSLRARLSWVLAVLTFAFTARAIAVDEASLSHADRQAIRRVIEQQLSAFKRKDGATAFSFAAPAIQQLFGTPESFMLMVSQNYPPIYRPRSHTFGELELVAGEWTQRVTVVSEDGTAVDAFYLMARQDDGSWRILGCLLVPVKKTVV